MGNGINNIASFKDYRVRPISASDFNFYDCTSNTRNTQKNYHILDAKHGDWPEDTFCRAVSKRVVPGNYYRIAVNMFIQGWRSVREAHNYVGLMYNAKDSSNYDFIYLRFVLWLLLLTTCLGPIHTILFSFSPVIILTWHTDYVHRTALSNRNQIGLKVRCTIVLLNSFEPIKRSQIILKSVKTGLFS